MNQQWLTILMSKGIELEQNLRQQLLSAKSELKSQLEERGIRLSAADLATLLEEISPKASRSALGYALDLIRPFSAGMGLKMTRLTDTQLEMVIPNRTHNLNDNNQIHEGALATAAMEAAKLLWMRHAPLGNFEILVTHFELEVIRSTKEECRLRMELSENSRELILAEIREHREAKTQAELKFFDQYDQAIADVRLQLQFKHTPALA